MTKKREPIDLVGRVASRLSLAREPRSEPSGAPPIAMRSVSSSPMPAPIAPDARNSEPRIIGRAPPRIEPTLVRSPDTAPATLREVPRPPAPEARPHAEPQREAQAAPVNETGAPTIVPVAPAPVLADRASVESTPADGAAAAGASAPTGTIDVPPVPPQPDFAPAATDAVDRETAAGRKQVELNLVRLHKEGYLTPQNQRSLIAEEYRIIKRPLLRAAFDRGNDPANANHVVMITSARPEEGKTFTAINLAMSVATERDLFVLLIDCDIRRMGLSKKLGLADRKGLMDVLIDPGLTIADVMLRTNIANLAIIPAGQPVEAATEVFASAKMTTLVDDIATRYPDRFIIFDAPPVLASSEPGVLAVHVGQTVMVVHANETSKRAVAQSIPLINGCPNVHFVLNRATLAAGTDRFGYYGTY